MTEDVGRAAAGDSPPGARRPGPVLLTIIALALLIGGATAMIVGLSGQAATPTPPALSARAAPADASAAATSDPAPSTAPAPTAPGSSGRPEPTRDPSAAPSAEPSADEGGPSEEAAPVALPVSVSIPAIDVTSDLLHLGLNPDGTLQVPQGPDFDTAAWYDGSPRPGQTGPAVIEGHVSSIARGPSVFFDLARLEVGDTVEVTREDGSVATFEVYDLQQFPKDAFPTVQVYGNTPGPELRLITCGGTIVESTGHFDDNIIVFAREV